MKVCIVGAGAIGGFIGTRLATAGGAIELTALARGATLAALQGHGWRLRSGGTLESAPAIASDRADTLGPQDVVIIAVKGPAMASVAATIGPLLDSHTVVVPALNGIPWWFSSGLPGVGSEPLETVDPDAAISAAIAARRVVGCVVHASAAVTEPGLVEHRNGQGIIVGEPDGPVSERLSAIAAMLRMARFDVTESTSVRHDIWYKLWGNLTMNPISAITGATSTQVLDDPLVRAFCSAAMTEMAAIGSKIGCTIDQQPEDRHQITAKLGAFRTSMLQDVESGRPIELDGIVAAVKELGVRVGVATPSVDALLGITRLFARVRGLYPGEGTSSS